MNFNKKNIYKNYSYIVYNHVTCGQWAYQMLQRILMENQYIFDIFKVSDHYIFVFSACMRNERSLRNVCTKVEM